MTNNVLTDSKWQGQILPVPRDLFIPPDALALCLEVFEGPLDLLLYLIKKNHFDIINIPVAEIAQQYNAYVQLMDFTRFGLAADYLAMAAWLAEIKSRLLLPQPTFDHVDDPNVPDPRLMLVERLQSYEKAKAQAAALAQLPWLGRDVFTVLIADTQPLMVTALPVVKLDELQKAFAQILKRRSLIQSHTIVQEQISVQDCLDNIVNMLSKKTVLRFETLFTDSSTRLVVAVHFLALLELLKRQVITLEQTTAYSPIYIRLLK